MGDATPGLVVLGASKITLALKSCHKTIQHSGDGWFRKEIKPVVLEKASLEER